MKNEAQTFLKNPSQVLTDLLIERKAKNSHYSARAFARDLGLSPAFLSQVMSEKRNLSLEQKLKLASQLGLNETVASTPQTELIQNTIEHEKIIKHWYHFAILELTQTGELPNQPKTIGKRLGISEIEARTAIERLLDFGYLRIDVKKKLKRTKAPFMIDIKSASQVIRNYHQSRLNAAHEELDHFDEARVDNRYMQTLFLPTSKKKVQTAKKMMLEFQNNLMKFLTDGSKEEVFQLSLQLFSAEKITQTELEPKKDE